MRENANVKKKDANMSVKIQRTGGRRSHLKHHSGAVAQSREVSVLFGGRAGGLTRVRLENAGGITDLNRGSDLAIQARMSAEVLVVSGIRAAISSKSVCVFGPKASRVSKRQDESQRARGSLSTFDSSPLQPFQLPIRSCSRGRRDVRRRARMTYCRVPRQLTTHTNALMFGHQLNHVLVPCNLKFSSKRFSD